jgi:hypothetical protein
MSPVHQLHLAAENLREILLIIELELRTGRNAEKRQQALDSFEVAVQRIGILRQHADDLGPLSGELNETLASLERKMTAIEQGRSYRIAAWLSAPPVSWYVCAESVEPSRELHHPC